MRVITDDALLASKTARRQHERRLRAPAAIKELMPCEEWQPDVAGGPIEPLQPHERMFPVEEWE